MFPIRETLAKKWWKLPLGAWLIVAFLLFLGFAIVAFLFFRRQVLQFRPEHKFAVSAPEFFGTAHALGDPAPVAGNAIQLLQNGDQIFPSMLEAIRSAKKSVNFEAFLFYSGGIGNQFRDALSERARAGVQVRVLLDGLGSGANLNNSDVDAMKSAGCHFAYYHPTHSWRIDRINRRSHRRVMVVDGTIGFTGGAGFADDWQGNADAPDHWRDTHARIEGPLVAKLQGAFEQHWVKETDEVAIDPSEFPALEPKGPLKAQVIASHSFSVAPLPMVQAVAIAAAEKTIFITNPYCTPTDDQVELLGRAVKRGVNVCLLLPGKHNDQPATKAAGRTAYGKLLKSGVYIFEYEATMIHAKTMVVDGLFSMFGSSNLDARSSQINEELDVTVYDEGFGAQMESAFAEDLKQSRPYTLENFNQRSMWERVYEALSEPFRAQL